MFSPAIRCCRTIVAGDRMRHTILIGMMLLAGTLGACSDIIQRDGGPCKYDTSTVTAKVIAIHDNTVEFEDEIENFTMRKTEFKTVPAVGDTLKLRRDMITEGTCNPIMYFVIPDEE